MRKVAIFIHMVFLGTCSLSGPLLAQLSDPPLEFYSQANQDRFVYSIICNLLGQKDSGYYLEIGAGAPTHINNTYFLENKGCWKGISIDISNHWSKSWAAQRSNPLLCEDALQCDYAIILHKFPTVIDYLSLDIDEYYDEVLEKVLLSTHRFKVITIEHDFYRYGDLYRGKERKILTEFGYHLLCADVACNGCSFEDWWIHPDFFPPDLFLLLTSLHLSSKDSLDIVELIDSLHYTSTDFE